MKNLKLLILAVLIAIVGGCEKGPQNVSVLGAKLDKTSLELTEGGKVAISMKRTVFGLKVKAENLTEGSLAIAMTWAPSMTITSPNAEIQDIFTFNKVREAWATDNYKESVEVAFTWTKADGVAVPIATKTFDFYRNKLTTITVAVSDKSEDNGVGVEIEDAQMTDGESYTVGAE